MLYFFDKLGKCAKKETQQGKNQMVNISSKSLRALGIKDLFWDVE